MLVLATLLVISVGSRHIVRVQHHMHDVHENMMDKGASTLIFTLSRLILCNASKVVLNTASRFKLLLYLAILDIQIFSALSAAGAPFWHMNVSGNIALSCNISTGNDHQIGLHFRYIMSMQCCVIASQGPSAAAGNVEPPFKGQVLARLRCRVSARPYPCLSQNIAVYIWENLA